MLMICKNFNGCKKKCNHATPHTESYFCGSKCSYSIEFAGLCTCVPVEKLNDKSKILYSLLFDL